MSYVVIKTVKGRRYRYEQRTWREGKRVRTESRYLGPADGSGRSASTPRPRRKGILSKIGELIAANTLSPEERAYIVDEEAMLQEVKVKEAAREKMRADFEAITGMRLGPVNPTPQEKAVPSIDYASPTLALQSPAETKSPAADAAGQAAPDAGADQG